MKRYLNKINFNQLKGQYLSFDALVATIIFILALSSLLNQWAYVSKYREFEDRNIHVFGLELSSYLEEELKRKSDIQEVTIQNSINAINSTIMPLPFNIGILVIANDSNIVTRKNIDYPTSTNMSVSIRRSIYMPLKPDNKFVVVDIYLGVKPS
ncbi:MAG: hypothetical protein N3E37_03350 [Candidatus Micrarchaeota archaeon]|nr:hypothetical protein [Candidatus Micrarchaeota archaeon]